MSVGFVFPGQGSQKTGMLQALAESDATVTDVFQQASDVLGYDLWQVVCDVPKEKLDSTDITQPAMLAAGYACWQIWQKQSDIKPDYMAGHSLGEYTALVSAGVIGFTDAIKLVKLRAEVMQAAIPPGKGAMAAILGLDDATVIAACSTAEAKGIVQAVNFNAPGQVVIAGETAAVEAAVAEAKQQGAKRAVMLPVSVPSHCELMRPAAAALAEHLAAIELKEPVIPVINNVDVKTASSATAIKDALVRQLYNPVRWVEIIQFMAAQGVDNLIECGPGKVLAGLNKRIDKTMRTQAVYDPDTYTKAYAQFK